MPLEPPEVIPAQSKDVMCDGDNGVAGHPRVYLTMGAYDFVDCPYCDRRFVLANPKARQAGH